MSQRVELSPFRPSIRRVAFAFASLSRGSEFVGRFAAERLTRLFHIDGQRRRIWKPRRRQTESQAELRCLMAPMSSDDGNEPPALGAGTRSFAAFFWGAHRCWGALRRRADAPTLLALFVALGVHTGAHDQTDSPDYNCKITTRWYLTAAFIGGARRSRTADLLNAILDF
jgi:hypothetical protein